MKVIAPSYYNKFNCIADKCKHNCCIGWEIDVDDETLKRYSSVDGEFGAKINSNIVMLDTPHFRLKENERCPFLNDRNLCDIISTLGEKYLCQICADHPRFRNFYDNRVEIGLGLSCEAACELILNDDNPFTLVEISNLEESETHNSSDDEFLNFKNELLKITNKENIPLNTKIRELLVFCDIDFPSITTKDIADFIWKLERLDSKWDNYINNLKMIEAETKKCNMNKDEQCFTNLLNYFIYRHVTNFEEYKEKMLFCILSIYIIYLIDGDTFEVARMYSSEIEYSDENLDKILMLLSNYN